MDDYVSKPIDPDALAAAIARWLGVDAPVAPVGTDTSAQGLRPDADALIDPSRLEELCETDPKLREKLVDIFERESETLVADIGRAIEIGDCEAVERAAHSLKGSSGSMGAVRMARICGQLCRLARTGLLSEAAGLREELEQTLEPTRAELCGRAEATLSGAHHEAST